MSEQPIAINQNLPDVPEQGLEEAVDAAREATRGTSMYSYEPAHTSIYLNNKLGSEPSKEEMGYKDGSKEPGAILGAAVEVTNQHGVRTALATADTSGGGAIYSTRKYMPHSLKDENDALDSHHGEERVERFDEKNQLVYTHTFRDPHKARRVATIIANRVTRRAQDQTNQRKAA